MDYQNLIKRRNFYFTKLQEAHSNLLYWQHAFQKSNAMLQPFLQMNPHLEFNPITQVNPHLEVNPFTQINPSLEVNPQTQINPELYSNVEVSPKTQAYFNFDPDLNVNIGNKFW